MIRPILVHPDIRLLQKSQSVIEFGKGLKNLATDMLDTMKAWKGIGIAAPQIGVLKRAIWVTWGNPPHFHDLFMVNPKEHTYYPDNYVDSIEGCLSLPGRVFKVKRRPNIWVAYQELSGRKRKMNFFTRAACIYAHEFSHLEGVLLSQDPNATELSIEKTKYDMGMLLIGRYRRHSTIT